MIKHLSGWPPFRAIYRTAVRWRFRLSQRRHPNQPVLVQVAGCPILVLPEVLNPKQFYSGEFLARALQQALIPPGAHVLDMGTGSGIAAVAAARLAARVVAVDINPAAVRCARINALLNGVEDRMHVRQGDLFAPVQDERFDVIIFNPPYLRGEPRTMFERALYATDVLERFCEALANHLRPGGCALLVLSSMAAEASFLTLFRDRGFSAEVASTTTLPLEVLTLYRLRLQSAQPG